MARAGSCFFLVFCTGYIAEFWYPYWWFTYKLQGWDWFVWWTRSHHYFFVCHKWNCEHVGRGLVLELLNWWELRQMIAQINQTWWSPYNCIWDPYVGLSNKVLENRPRRLYMLAKLLQELTTKSMQTQASMSWLKPTGYSVLVIHK